MKLSLVIAACVAWALVGCDAAVGGNAHAHVHRTMPAAGLRTLDVRTISGDVTIRAVRGAVVTIDADETGSPDAVANTRIESERSGDALTIRSRTTNTGWFGRNTPSVSYRITVPADVAVHAGDVSGDIDIAGMRADIDAGTVSGDVAASVGRMSGSRHVTLDAVSGTLKAAVARNSDVHITAKTLSGDIRQFAEGDVHDLRLGRGTATLHLSTVSGDITVTPQ